MRDGEEEFCKPATSIPVETVLFFLHYFFSLIGQFLKFTFLPSASSPDGLRLN